MAGDIAAMAFARDTQDGKPAQAIIGDNDEDPISVVVTGVPRAGDTE
jgi:hypothetical protein